MSLYPSLEPIHNGAILTLDNGATVHLTSVLQVEQLLSLLRKAHNVLDGQARDKGTLLDRRAAQLLNEINEEMHREYGHTIAGWPPAPVQRIPITACECTRTVLCDEHRDAS